MLEREGRGENFVNRKRLNIVARSVAAVSIAAAGAAAVERLGSFDPLTNPVDSANHLVLNNLHESYDQLIDKLPEVDIAYATPPAPSLIYPSPNGAVTNGVCNSQQIDFSPHSATMHVGDSLTFIVDACLKSGGTDSPVKLVEEDGAFDDTLDNEAVFIVDGSVRLFFYLDCEDAGIFPNILRGYAGYSQDSGGDAQLAVELRSSGSTNRYDNIGAETGAAEISCLDLPPPPTPCPNGSGNGAGNQEGNTAGSCSVGVGGIAKLPDVEALQQNMNSEKNIDYTIPIAAGVAGTIAAAITATGGLLYSRRNRSSK